MAAFCPAFGISRKTGHKIFARYREHGLEALGDRPQHNANRMPPVEAQIVALKGAKPHWGARKLPDRDILVQASAPEPSRANT